MNNRSVINVTLESESKELEEVMVVAYATTKKYSFTGAASTMKAGEIEKLQTSSISRVLEGTVSGGEDILHCGYTLFQLLTHEAH